MILNVHIVRPAIITQVMVWATAIRKMSFAIIVAKSLLYLAV